MNNPLKSWLWRTLLALAVLIIAGSCFYAVIGHRGLRAWEDARRELAARGESADWKDFIPLPVPDDQNFFEAPMMTEWFVRSPTNDSPATLSSRMRNPETTSTNPITALAASNYVAWCATFEPEFDQIRTALKRPSARMDGNYDSPLKQPMPNFLAYRVAAQTLSHRVQCLLRLGDSEKALADLTLLDDLNRTLAPKDRPLTLLAGMIHVAIAGLYVETVKFGINSNAWHETELASLQKQLSEINLLRALANCLRAERADQCHTIETLAVDDLKRSLLGNTKSASDFVWHFFPRGWTYKNMAVIATVYQGYIESFDLRSNTVSPFKLQTAAFQQRESFGDTRPWNYIAAICIPDFLKAPQVMARNQTLVNQAEIVCALERYHLANGSYPDKLAELTPKFIEKIPQDIIGGKPLVYSRIKDSFKLYSVGWNESDDGGITVFKDDGTEDRDKGDWVWRP